MIQLGRFIVLKGVGNLGSTEKVEQKPVIARERKARLMCKSSGTMWDKVSTRVYEGTK